MVTRVGHARLVTARSAHAGTVLPSHKMCVSARLATRENIITRRGNISARLANPLLCSHVHDSGGITKGDPNR